MSSASNHTTRLKLRQRLAALSADQLSQLIFVLKPPHDNIPPPTAAPAQRITAFLEWAESPMGCGLEALEQQLDQLYATQVAEAPTPRWVRGTFQKPVVVVVAIATTTLASLGVFRVMRPSQQITIGGDVGEGANVANQLQIFEGDSPAEKQRKIDQAKTLIAEEILSNMTHLDARLGFVDTALVADDFHQRLQQVRDQVAPALATSFEAGYQQLIQAQTVASLRSAFASAPLSEVRAPLTQVLLDANVDAGRVQTFYDNLASVRDASESLLHELDLAADQTLKHSDRPELLEHHRRRVKNAIARLTNRAHIAHISGLMVLNSLEVPLPQAGTTLSRLNHLQPQQLISQFQATRLMQQQLTTTEILLAEQAELVAAAAALRDAALEEYAHIDQSLEIQPSDRWDEVVSKAISLRQLGRTSEAVAAFSRYRDMFTHDPTAANYAKTAQQFTLQLTDLQVNGGIYLYEVTPGVAADAGLQMGDIIIRYNRQTVAAMPDMVAALEATTADDTVELVWLRLEAGRFRRLTRNVAGGTLGVGMMPI